MGKRFRTVLLSFGLALWVAACPGDETGAEYEQAFEEALQRLPDVPAEQVSADLAERLGDEAIPFLKQQVLLDDEPQSAQIAVLTLQHLESEDAARALAELCQAQGAATVRRLAMRALKGMSVDRARPALENLASEADDASTRWLALVALQGQGDEATVSRLREIAESEVSAVNRAMMEFTIKLLQHELDSSMTEGERQEWRAWARDFADIVFNPDMSRSLILADIRTARRLAKRGRYPFAFLRLHVEEAPEPSGVAMYLMAIQREPEAEPILRKYSEERSHAGEMAQAALRLLDAGEEDELTEDTE